MTQVRTHSIARKAYECVTARRDCPEKKKYAALAHSLPGMILENGLAQTTGFLLAKGGVEHHALLDDLHAVLRTSQATTAVDRCGLHQTVIDSDLQQTVVLTRYSLEASGWLKRYVQGVLRVGATGDEDGEDGES